MLEMSYIIWGQTWCLGSRRLSSGWSISACISSSQIDMTHPSHTFSNWSALILAALICQPTWSANVCGNIEVSLVRKSSHVRESSLSDIVVWLEPFQQEPA